MPQTEERSAPRPFCSDHCSTCGQHFHGLGAFDRHRVDGECAEDPAALLIRSRSGDEHPSLQVWTDEGYCRLSKGCWADGKNVKIAHPVTIYQVWQSAEQQLALAELSR